MVDGSTQRWRAALCLRWRARWRWLTTLGLLSVSFTRLFCCCCLRGGPLFVFEDASFSQLVYREFNRKRTGWEQKEGSTMRAHSKELLPPTSANTSSESLNHLKAPCKKSFSKEQMEKGMGKDGSLLLWGLVATVNKHERTDVKLSNQAAGS